MIGTGYVGLVSEDLIEALVETLGTATLQAGDLMRLGIESRGRTGQAVRASVYRGGKHVGTVALDDRRQYVRGYEPEPNSALSEVFQGRRAQAVQLVLRKTAPSERFRRLLP